MASPAGTRYDGGPDEGNITLTGPLDFNRLGVTNGTLRLDADNQPIPTYDQEVVEAFARAFTAG